MKRVLRKNERKEREGREEKRRSFRLNVILRNVRNYDSGVYRMKNIIRIDRVRVQRDGRNVIEKI